jgi:hypothetical protein
MLWGGLWAPGTHLNQTGFSWKSSQEGREEEASDAEEEGMANRRQSNVVGDTGDSKTERQQIDRQREQA